jgi:hypothetical protein
MPDNEYIISYEDLMELIRNKNAKVTLYKKDSWQEDATLELEEVK